MAEVTITRLRSYISGNRKRVVAFVDIAADGDTLTLGSIMHRIEAASILSETNNAIGMTTSQGSGAALTFQTAGAESNVHVAAEGQ